MERSPAERFRNADAVFDAALDLPTGERAAYVDRACGEDAELRVAVHALLRLHERAGDFLDAAAAELARPFIDTAELPPAPALAPPARVGPFRVVREIGHGGMGTVYLAERDDGQFHQRVALKLVRGGLADAHLLRRFLDERRILASLEHPQIARLVDGGITADGLPYFAMEYVEGEPITAFCDRLRLGVDERLRLFLDVCEAVQYAHRNLVVHRDIKPSNVLVSADRRVKLLDFGIARLLECGDEPATVTRQQMLTPEYASPEQFRGDHVTTATDVYSLGMLLYVLLTGRHPYRRPGTPRRLVEQQVLGDEVPGLTDRAHAAAADEDGDDAQRASLRGTTPGRLRRRLRGDLDTIVRKAVRKDAGRRYPTVDALVADLRRHLGGLPVEARPESLAYRARKFVGRNRAAVAAAVAFVLFGTGFALREAELRERAEASALEATASARRAEAVKDFLIGVFEVSDPYGLTGERGESVTARTLLDRGAERLETDMALEPDVRAELGGVLGRVYTSLGLYDQAAPLLERTLAQRRSQFAAPHAAIANALAELGAHHLARSAHAEAEPLLREALDMRRLLHGERDLSVAQSLDRMGTLEQERSNYDAAEGLLREALGIRRALLGPDHPELATALHNLGLLLWWKADFPESERLYREALAIRLRALPADHLFTLQTMHNLAQVLQAQGRFDEAEARFRESLDAKRRTLGDAHPSVTIHLNNLGRLLADRGEMDESEALIRQALALDRQIFGAEHSFVAASLDHLGATLRAKGDFDGAEAAYRQALDLNRRMLGADHGRTALSIQNLGVVYYLRGDLTSARAHLSESLGILRQRYGADHPFTVSTEASLARTLSDQGDDADALPLFVRVIDRLRPQMPRGRDVLANALIGHGRLLVKRGRASEAIPLFEEARELGFQHFGGENRRSAEADLGLGLALMALGREAEAVSGLERSHAFLQASPIRLPRLVQESSAALTDALARSGRPARARPSQ